MDNKIVMISIAAVIGIIVLGSVLMPILDDATTVNETFTNEGYYTLDKVTSDTNAVITWNTTTPTTLTVNDTTLDMTEIGSGRSYTIAGSDTFVLRYLDNNTNVFLQCFGTKYTSVIANGENSIDVTITISGGTLNFYATDGGDSPINEDYSIGTDCYMINPTNTGDYVAVMKKADVPAYVLNDSTFTLIGVSISDYSSGIALYGKGSIDDGVTVSTLYKPNSVTTVTYSEPVITDEELTAYNDLYSLDKIQFNITRDNQSPVAVTYSYFIVPAEVTAERSVHFTDGQNAIFAAIPVMIILAVLLGVVALVIRSRMD